MRKARSRRQSTRLDRSSPPERAAQNTQPTGARAAPTYPMRQGAQRRFTPGGESSRVDELAQSLSDLEERDPYVGDVHARPGLGVAPLARVPVTDTEAPEPPQLDLIALRQRVGDIVEDRVDDRLGFLLGQVRDLRDFVDQVRFGHRRLPS